MESLKIYEINANYIDYLLPFAPHLFQRDKLTPVNISASSYRSTGLITSPLSLPSSPSMRK